MWVAAGLVMCLGTVFLIAYSFMKAASVQTPRITCRFCGQVIDTEGEEVYWHNDRIPSHEGCALHSG